MEVEVVVIVKNGFQVFVAFDPADAKDTLCRWNFEKAPRLLLTRLSKMQISSTPCARPCRVKCLSKVDGSQGFCFQKNTLSSFSLFRFMNRRILQGLFLFLLFFIPKGQCQTSKVAAGPDILMETLKRPQPVNIAGVQVLIYELLVTNTSDAEYCLTSLLVSEGSSRKELLSFNVADLSEITWQIEAIAGNQLRLGAGKTAVVYLEIPMENLDKTSALNHQLKYETCAKSTSPEKKVISYSTAIEERSPIVLGPPLRGGPWAAIHSPAWPRGHRRVIYTQDGKDRIPGRFAIDFMKLDEKGSYAPANEDLIGGWYGYGAGVLAVADATVATTDDSFAESFTLTAQPNYRPEQATGNYISLRVGDSLYVFYEHLQPGSILVKPGQAVKKGEVIARLGFTGQTTGPHLHFHMADANSPLGAEGIPYVFESFILLGRYPDMGKFGNELWTPDTLDRKARIHERPDSNSVIIFK